MNHHHRLLTALAIFTRFCQQPCALWRFHCLFRWFLVSCGFQAYQKMKMSYLFCSLSQHFTARHICTTAYPHFTCGLHPTIYYRLGGILESVQLPKRRRKSTKDGERQPFVNQHDLRSSFIRAFAVFRWCILICSRPAIFAARPQLQIPGSSQ